MNNRKTRGLVATFILLIVATVAHAQANRTYVRSNGVDTGNCPVAAPCLTLSYAHSVTNDTGFIVALDSFGYGIVTITKAITIEAVPGAYIFIKPPTGTAGITVASGAGKLVMLRNIQIDAQGATNTTGVSVSSGNVMIENCTFTNNIVGVLTVASGSNVRIHSSSFHGNTIGLQNIIGQVRVQRSTFSKNTTAVRAEGNGGYSTSSLGTQELRPNGPTTVYIANSIIDDNGSAFEMHNAGFRPSGQCNGANIFFESTGGIANNHRVGNTNYLTLSGTTEQNAGCGSSFTIGIYQDQQ